jgi:hypothetical protein
VAIPNLLGHMLHKHNHPLVPGGNWF